MDLKDAVTPVARSSVEKNEASLMEVRHTVALAAGCVAGILRLESLHGFGFYAGVYAATALFLFVIGGQPARFFLNPWKAVLWTGVLSALPGYVLSWSLIYSLVET